MALRYVILVALTDQKMTGYEITKEFDLVLGYFWRASHQQVYRELTKMAEERLVSFRNIPQEGKPDKKVYASTAKGRAALKAWLLEEIIEPPAKNPLLVKVYSGLLAGKPALRAHIAAYQNASKNKLRAFKEIEAEHYPEEIEEMEDWKKLAYLTLRFGFLRHKMQLQWAKEAQQILDIIDDF